MTSEYLNTPLAEASELLRQIFSDLPPTADKSKLAARWGEALAKAGDLGNALEFIRSTENSVQQLGSALERGFALVHIAEFYNACGLRSEGSSALKRAECVAEEVKSFPGTSSLLLLLLDAVVKAGDLDWGERLIAALPERMRDDALRGTIRRCAIEGRWSDVFQYLADPRLASNRPLAAADVLLTAIERAAGDVRTEVIDHVRDMLRHPASPAFD